jgi:hypothetical protein
MTLMLTLPNEKIAQNHAQTPYKQVFTKKNS